MKEEVAPLLNRDVCYALPVITGNVVGPCVMWILRSNVPYFYGARLRELRLLSLVLLGLEV